MQITTALNLSQLADSMGSAATRDDAAVMLELLIAGGVTDTNEIGEGEWLDLCERAVEGAARNAELSGESLVGQRVEAGAGDDHDTGTVERVMRSGAVFVSWDSGVKTPADVASLRRL